MRAREGRKAGELIKISRPKANKQEKGCPENEEVPQERRVPRTGRTVEAISIVVYPNNKL